MPQVVTALHLEHIPVVAATKAKELINKGLTIRDQEASAYLIHLADHGSIQAVAAVTNQIQLHYWQIVVRHYRHLIISYHLALKVYSK